MISCQKHEISPQQIFNGESNLPTITAISQEILNQPYRVPRKSGKKKTPCKPYHPQGVPVDQPGLYQVKFSLSTPGLSNGLFRSSTTTLYS